MDATQQGSRPGRFECLYLWHFLVWCANTDALLCLTFTVITTRYSTASILSHPDLRRKPVLIALNKVDTLPLGASNTPSEEIRDGTQLSPTDSGGPLDTFEENVRSWISEHFTQAQNPVQGDQEAREVRESNVPPVAADATPPDASTPPSEHVGPVHSPNHAAGRDSSPESNAPWTETTLVSSHNRKEFSAENSATGNLNTSATEPLDPASDPLSAAAAFSPTSTPSTPVPHEDHSSSSQEPQYTATYRATPSTSSPSTSSTEQCSPSHDMVDIDQEAVSERYWEVVCVSAVSLYVQMPLSSSGASLFCSSP